MRASVAKARVQAMPYDEGVATRELGAILQDHEMLEAATKQLQKLDAWADADEATELLTLVQPARARRGSGSALKQIAGAMMGGIASRVSSNSSRKNSRTGSVIGGSAAPTAADGLPPRAPSPQPNGREAPEGESPKPKAKPRPVSPLVGDSHDYLTA